MIKFDVVNLDNIFVVTKRMSGIDYFVSGRSTAVTYTNINRAYRFATREEAQKTADTWTLKQKKRFKVQPLSKFMVNNFSISTNRYADKVEEKVIVSSKPMPISNVMKWKHDFQLELNQKRSNIVADLNQEVLRLDQKDKEQRQELERMQMQIEKDIAERGVRKEQYKLLAKEVEAFDIDQHIEQFKTKTDNTMKTLYGKKVTENTLTTQDGKMFLLPLKGN